MPITPAVIGPSISESLESLMPEFRYVDHARQSVESYVSVKSLDVIEESRQAIDCLNCEANLQNGINAWNFIMKADEAIHWALCKNHITDDEGEDLLTLIDRLVTTWLGPFDRMTQWISRCEARGYKVEYKDRFLACLEEARANAKYDPQQPMPECILDLKDEALREHENGETAEFL